MRSGQRAYLKEELSNGRTPQQAIDVKVVYRGVSIDFDAMTTLIAFLYVA